LNPPAPGVELDVPPLPPTNKFKTVPPVVASLPETVPPVPPSAAGVVLKKPCPPSAAVTLKKISVTPDGTVKVCIAPENVMVAVQFGAE
jgi:hypothetical protein